jgi:hypothetical protein
LNFSVAFKSALPDGTEPDFQPVQDALPVILTDEEGNRWDVFLIKDSIAQASACAIEFRQV